MQRAPSLALAPRSSLRRRSGAFSPNLNVAAPEHLSPTQSVESTSSSEPTVLLVKSSKPSPPLPPLPSFSSATSSPTLANYLSRTSSYAHSQAEDDAAAPFSPIPLTPRPDAPPREPSQFSIHSNHTSGSHISRLPSPDFSAPRKASQRSRNKLSSFLPRGLSFSSFRSSTTARTQTPDAASAIRPESMRSQSSVSKRSFCSDISSGTSSSVDTGYLSLIPSIGTTNNFTNKWPKPKSVRNATGRMGWILNAGVGAVVEEERGVGMDKVGRWTSFKWCMVLSVISVFVYGAAGLVCAVLTWFRTWNQADVMYVADNDILILITLASSILLFTALVGITGTLLNSKPIVAVYTLLLWPAFVSMLAVGYTAYKRSTFSLDKKLNLAWSQYYTPLGRLLIQNSLSCCGFYDALHEATPSKRCYTRTPLPGCKGKLYRFEKGSLGLMWSATFALCPLHILNMVVSLLCANHLTRNFGKGITPKQYRLCGMDVRADAEKIFGQLRLDDEIEAVARPDLSRAPSSRLFREDREENMYLLVHE